MGDEEQTVLRGTSSGSGHTVPDASTQLRVTPPATALPGTHSIIDGRYELLELLGSGGMGEVFKAIDLLARKEEDPDPFLAVKVLRSELQSDQLAVLSLQREANRARKITHPNVLRIHQFEQARETGLYYITMELLQGSSLQRRIGDHPYGQRWEEIEPLFIQACDGLQCAHDSAIVHSDIKPSNLFITTRSQLKVLDFGIAAPMMASGDARETRFDPRKIGAMSPGYASLETFLGLKPHYSDDVYSLACVVYEWLSGKPPHTVPDHPGTPMTAPEALDAKLTPAPLPHLTRAQNRALREALALRRDERTQTIGEFRDAMAGNSSSQWTVRRVAGLCAGVLAIGGLALASVRVLLRHPTPPVTVAATTSSAETSAPHRAPTPPQPIPERTASLPAAPNTPASDCEGGMTMGTLESTLDGGIKAQVNLALLPRGSGGYAIAAESLRKSVACLRALEAAGISTPAGSKFLREAGTRGN